MFNYKSYLKSSSIYYSQTWPHRKTHPWDQNKYYSRKESFHRRSVIEDSIIAVLNCKKFHVMKCWKLKENTDSTNKECYMYVSFIFEMNFSQIAIKLFTLDDFQFFSFTSGKYCFYTLLHRFSSLSSFCSEVIYSSWISKETYLG